MGEVRSKQKFLTVLICSYLRRDVNVKWPVIYLQFDSKNCTISAKEVRDMKVVNTGRV